jgi:phosphoribosyl 1,2-cyclic phosphodiesterase
MRLFCFWMPLFVCSLNSGSNGNCYYIGNEEEAVLIDAGISCRETEKRMRRAGLDIKSVKAIFISHEHGDHIRGVEVLSSRFQLPVYITPLTLQHSKLNIAPANLRTFKAYQTVAVGALEIQPFPKLHDAIDAHSFIVSGNGANIGVLTDIGAPCTHVIDHFSQCHAAFLEANYDVGMLENGRYPYHLKRRISSDVGHLSNEQALELFLAYRPPYMSHIFLSHLSKDNNSPEIAQQLFLQHAGNTQIIVASRYNETGVYQIGAKAQEMKPAVHQKAVQVSLF